MIFLILVYSSGPQVIAELNRIEKSNQNINSNEEQNNARPRTTVVFNCFLKEYNSNTQYNDQEKLINKEFCNHFNALNSGALPKQ